MGGALRRKRPLPTRSPLSVPILGRTHGAEYRNEATALVGSASRRRLGCGEPSEGTSRPCFLLDVLPELCDKVPELVDCHDSAEAGEGSHPWVLLVMLQAMWSGDETVDALSQKLPTTFAGEKKKDGGENLQVRSLPLGFGLRLRVTGSWSAVIMLGME